MIFYIKDTKVTKPVSGYIFALGGATVSRKYSKQTCITRSTIKSNLIALIKAWVEVEWFCCFLEDMPM